MQIVILAILAVLMVLLMGIGLYVAIDAFLFTIRGRRKEEGGKPDL